MIRRISKHCDLKDIIKSCPSGVIDDIYAIEYYIQGNNVVINASFTQVGNELVVVLPTSQLELLPNGILMRRAFYKVVDTSYPDGYYNLEFEDNMNIWLGDYESEEPVIPDYVTEDELSSTLISYATQDWVSSQQFLTSESLPSDLATQSWVQSQGYLTASTIPSDIATEEWVRSYTYDSSTIDYACGKAEDNAIDWVQEQGYLTASTIPSDIATQSWVQSQGYLTVGDLPSGLATQSWVESYTYDKSMIEAFAGKARVDALSDAQAWVSSQQFATQSWVQSQGYLTSVPSEYATQQYVLERCGEVQSAIYAEEYITPKDLGNALDGYATETWVQEQGYLTQHQDLTGYATQSWVRSYTYDKSIIDALVGKAQVDALSDAQEWVSSQQFATKSWVNSQQYATQQMVADLGDTFNYRTLALESYVSSLESGLGNADAHIAALEASYSALSAYVDAFVSEFNSAGYVTESWISGQGFITDDPDNPFVQESFVTSAIDDALSGLGLSSYATQSWVSSQGYLTSVPSEYATESWVQSQSYLTSASISTYVTESAIESMGFATQSWVSSQGYLTSVPSEYATQAWVESQSYLSTADFSSYATQSWVSSNFLDLSKIWTGTQSQWDELTADQQSFYTIALITV